MTIIEKQKKFFNEVVKPRLVALAVDDKIPSDMNNIDWYDFVGEAAKHNTEEEKEPKIACGRYIGSGQMCGEGVICEKCEKTLEEFKQLRRDVRDLREGKQAAFIAYSTLEQQKLDLKTENQMVKLLLAGLLAGAIKDDYDMAPHHKGALYELLGFEDKNGQPTLEDVEELIRTGRI